jgi:phosphatidylserine decarboxylase
MRACGAFVARAGLQAASLPITSRLAGRLADLRLPGKLLRALIRAYARVYGVNLAEAAEPLTAFDCFDAFFTRRLRPGARPLDPDPAAMLNPCDGRLQSWGRLTPAGRLEQIKGHDYSLAALLGSSADAALFEAGVHATLYLSPAMYHRVHAPAQARVRAVRYVPGRLFPVNAPAVRHVPGLFTRNERLVVQLDSTRFGALAVVLVGAANVGRISLTCCDLRSNSGAPAQALHPTAPVDLARGDELGTFHLGSTVVLLAADPTLVPAEHELGDFVPLGRALWRQPTRST